MQTMTSLLEASLSQEGGKNYFDESIRENVLKIGSAATSKLNGFADIALHTLNALTDFENGLDKGLSGFIEGVSANSYYNAGYSTGTEIREITEPEAERRWEVVLSSLNRELKSISDGYDPVSVLIDNIRKEDYYKKVSRGLRVLLGSYPRTARNFLVGTQVELPLGPKTREEEFDFHARNGLADVIEKRPASADYEFAQALDIARGYSLTGRPRNIAVALCSMHSGEFAVRVFLKAYEKTIPYRNSVFKI